MTQYLLSVHPDYEGAAPDADALEQTYRAVDAFNASLLASGAWVFAGGLHPPETATVVRVRGDEVLTTGGPYAQTRDHLGGFWVIRAADRDEALAWAARAAAACGGPVEVRPFEDDGTEDLQEDDTDELPDGGAGDEPRG